jgi:hypothetical protein
MPRAATTPRTRDFFIVMISLPQLEWWSRTGRAFEAGAVDSRWRLLRPWITTI